MSRGTPGLRASSSRHLFRLGFCGLDSARGDGCWSRPGCLRRRGQLRVSRAQLLVGRLLVSCGASVSSARSSSLRLDCGSAEPSRRVDTAEGRERKHGRPLAVAWSRLRVSTAALHHILLAGARRGASPDSRQGSWTPSLHGRSCTVTDADGVGTEWPFTGAVHAANLDTC